MSYQRSLNTDISAVNGKLQPIGVRYRRFEHNWYNIHIELSYMARGTVLKREEQR